MSDQKTLPQSSTVVNGVNVTQLTNTMEAIEGNPEIQSIITGKQNTCHRKKESKGNKNTSW